jgi:hypothetical protein
VEREKDKREEIEKKVEKGGLGARPCINIYLIYNTEIVGLA